MKYKIHTTIFIAIALLAAGFCPSADAAKPDWKDVPDLLKQSRGVKARANWVYATGKANISDIRRDKGYEFARKKSRHRALQWLRFGGDCEDLVNDLPEDMHENFFSIFLAHMPPLHIEQLQTIRQWETKDHAFTTVAAPAPAISGLDCPFSDITDLISHYIDQPNFSLNGLAFCLKYAPRYSKLESRIQSKTGQFLKQHGYLALANCFIANNAMQTSTAPLMLQHKMYLAAEYKNQAEQLAADGEWKDALAAIDNAVSLMPSYSPAYLILGEYLLHEKNQPELALAAAQKALRDGSCFEDAMKLNFQCLNQLNSDEAEIYEYLLEKSKDRKAHGYPAQLNDDSLTLKEEPLMASLIVNSSGCAIEGPDQKPDTLFNQAVTQFQNAGSDTEVREVMALLFQAIEQQSASAKTHNLIGACLRHLNQPVLALPFLWQAVRLKPDYDLALTNLGICCDMLGHQKSADYYFNHPVVAQSNNKWVKKQTNAFKQK